MNKSTNTHQVTSDLDHYLKSHDYIEGTHEKAPDQEILTVWEATFTSAIAADISSRFDKVEIGVITSEFELSSADNRGACLFLQQIAISDHLHAESVRAFVKTLVNYNKTTIYLESHYATVDKWPGKSKILKLIFDRLKAADKNPGYFNPTSLTDFVK